MEHLQNLVRSCTELTAQDLDLLISTLAEVRAAKSPPVSSTRPEPTNESAINTPVTVEDSPAMQARQLRDGRIRLWARSSGFGWLAFNLDLRDACTLRDWMTANVHGESDLFSQQSTEQH